DDFRKAAGRRLSVDPDCILIGNGSDDVLTILTRAFVPEGGLIASPTPSYILYRSLAEIQGARFAAVPFDDWHPDEKAWPRDADLSFAPNPNSPSGTESHPVQLRIVATRTEPHPLVVDEAYIDFAEEPECSSVVRQVKYCPNLIVTRTLSKSYSLAGI